MWACYCSCGEYCIKRQDGLQTYKEVCCDHLKHNSLVGQKFGHLLVVHQTKEYHKTRGWKYLCYCDCGNLTPVYALHRDLCLHGVESCGCLIGKARMIDLTGKRFGFLTAIKPTEKRQGKSIIWECKCDCGKTVERSCSSLTSGFCASCGCMRYSYGEAQIKHILDDNSIEYRYDKKFSDCKFPSTNKSARFDFYLNYSNPDSSSFIEFDGDQHKGVINEKWGNANSFIATHNRDLFKNQWAWDRNIPMKRIPYSERDNLNIDRLLSDEFLITPETHPWWYPPEGASYPYFTINDFDKIKEVS